MIQLELNFTVRYSDMTAAEKRELYHEYMETPVPDKLLFGGRLEDFLKAKGIER